MDYSSINNMHYKYLLFSLINFMPLLSKANELNFYQNTGGNSTLTWTIKPQASLEFSFKTNSKERTVHILTAYEPVNRTVQLSLKIESLTLEMCYGPGCTYEDEILDKVTFGDKWNDMEWHKVQIRVTKNELLIDIDGIEAMLLVDKITHSKRVQLYFGGSPEDSQYGFTGCIKNVSYPIGRPRKLKVGSKMVQRKCLDNRCFDRKKNSCSRKSECFGPNPTCKCKGFLTPTINCDSSIELSRYLSADTVIKDKINFPFQKSRLNTIEFTFRTNEPDGILVYNPKLLVELVNGYLEIQWSMGADWIVMKIDRRLHDGVWHSVSLKRYGQQVVLNINQTYELRKSFLYYPQTSQCNEIPELIFIGGYTYPAIIKRSKTKKNFAGCLTRMYIYNEIDINRETAYDYIMKDSIATTRVVEGTPFKKCSVPQQTVKQNIPKAIGPMAAQSKSTKLTQNTVAWITAGICVGAIAMIFTLACGFHLMRKKYSGHFTAKSEMNNAYQFGTLQGKMLEGKKKPKGVVV